MGIASVAAASPDAAAIVTLSRTITFAELDARHRKLAGAFAAAGVGRGDHVAVLARNRPEYLEVTIGALRAGILPVPIHHRLAPPEVSYIVEDSGAQVLLTDRQIDPLPSLQHIVTFGDAYERWLHESDPVDIADVMLTRPMHYTSGTTAQPKGVWIAPADESVATQRSSAFRSLWGITSDDVHLVCSPLSHSAPHRYAARTLEAGGRVVLQEHFDPRETLAAVELFGATSVFMVPTHLERIYALSRRDLARHGVGSIRLLAHAGAPIRDETKRRTIDHFPRGSVWEFYGSTEGQATRISTDEWLERPGSVGRAIPGAEILVLDASGEACPAGEVGQVWVRDPDAERFSYWRDDAKTRAAWRNDAFTVGDVGYVDDDGYLFLTGRAHNTIISGGVNVYPEEVEQVLGRHPGIAEVMVFGTPSDEWGELVSAAIVPAEAGAPDETALREWCSDRLAAYKHPRRIVIVERLPRTPTGKLRRSQPPI